MNGDDAWRLNLKLVCPYCYCNAKPIFLSRVGPKQVSVRCPEENCGKEWIYNAEED